MFRTEYKREMDALEPSWEAMARLEGLTKGENVEKPVKHFSRRAVIALALCAALAMTAVAAGPSVWSALSEHLGPFGAWVVPLTGSSTSAGVELEVVGVLSDGASARFYLTARDQRGGRLDRHTDAIFDLEPDPGAPAVWLSTRRAAPCCWSWRPSACPERRPSLSPAVPLSPTPTGSPWSQSLRTIWKASGLTKTCPDFLPARALTKKTSSICA